MANIPATTYPAAPGPSGAPVAPQVPYYGLGPQPAGPPQVFQMPPIFNDMMLELRDSNDMLRASLAQQRDFVRYTQDLNDWFNRDRRERRHDVRTILNAVEDLRRRGEIPAVSASAAQGTGPSVPQPAQSIRAPSVPQPAQTRNSTRPAIIIPSPTTSTRGGRVPRAQTPYPRGLRQPAIPSSELDSPSPSRLAGGLGFVPSAQSTGAAGVPVIPSSYTDSSRR